MKLSLPWRIGLVIALTGALAAGLAGYYSYRASCELLIAGAEDRLQTATRVLSRQLALALDAGARDVLVLALHPQAARLLAGTEPSELQARFERNTALLMEGIVRTHPEYLQLRLIDAQAHGVERIRVDRSDGALRRIEDFIALFGVGFFFNRSCHYSPFNKQRVGLLFNSSISLSQPDVNGAKVIGCISVLG